MDILESNVKNYKSLFEEIAQNDSELYLTKSFQDAIRYSESRSGNSSADDDTRCCCCKVHRKQHQNTNEQVSASFIAGGVVSNTKSFSDSSNIYSSILIGEMKNATDYIEYLNETRRNSFSSLNKENRSNYYNLMFSDCNSLNSYANSSEEDKNSNFLQVPKLNIPDEQMRRTPEFKDISKKIDQIHALDSNVSSLIYKSIEVHADILVRNF